MPIRPSERGRYPRDWPSISRRIRYVRAGGRCECPSPEFCGSRHHLVDVEAQQIADRDRCPAINRVTGSRCGMRAGHDADPNSPHVPEARLIGPTTRCLARQSEPHPSTGSTVVLTVAHLDHTPENVDDANLLAMCQACHLSHDREHHNRTRKGRNQ